MPRPRGFRVDTPPDRQVELISPAVFLAAAAGQSQPVLVAESRSPAIREAVAAQAKFERGRRQALPVTGASRGRCDASIGRFCYWYDDGDTSLPREPEAIRRDRGALIAGLERVHRSVPDDDWLWGQRLRYLADQDLPDSAVRIAEQCSGTLWWCHALTAFALHIAGHYPAAESAIARAVSTMPEPIRCAWSDWSKVLGDQTLGGTDLEGCAARQARMDTLFWLAQPLLSISGNDLETELFARRVMIAIQGSAVPPQLVTWGRDLEELTLRYGWSKRWSVSAYPSASVDQPSLIGHDRPPAYWFFPTGSDSAGWRWDLTADRPPSRHGPSYSTQFDATEDASVAVFPRGDSSIVVAAFGERAWGRKGPLPGSIALAASTGPGSPTAVARIASDRLTTPLLLRMMGAPRLLGLEAETDTTRRHLRYRALRPHPDREGLILSDPLLFHVTETLPATVEEAAGRMLPGRRISKREPVGVFWEWSGAGADSLDVAVAMAPMRRGLLGRLAQGLSLAKRRLALTLQWQAGQPAAPTEPRAIELDLSRLSPGRYQLLLTATSVSTKQTATMDIELVP